MSDPYLIAHLVRGEPAFDIAIRMDGPDEDGDEWWIIPTSGHRAYPWYAVELKHLQIGYHDRPTVAPTDVRWDNIDWRNYPDHYPHSASPTPRTAPDLRSLGLARPQPKIARRI